MSTVRKVNLAVRIPEELKERLVREAQEAEMTLSEWVRVRFRRSVLVPKEDWKQLEEKVEAEKRAIPLSSITPETLALGCMRRGMKGR